MFPPEAHAHLTYDLFLPPNNFKDCGNKPGLGKTSAQRYNSCHCPNIAMAFSKVRKQVSVMVTGKQIPEGTARPAWRERLI